MVRRPLLNDVQLLRDLFGTMQNEGASKGILVTTSGYGKASFEFADGKPLELLSGSNLLYLLAEHGGMEARIEPPEDWVDPEPDAPDSGEEAESELAPVPDSLDRFDPAEGSSRAHLLSGSARDPGGQV